MRWRRAPIRYHRRHIVPGRQCWCEPKVVEEEPGKWTITHDEPAWPGLWQLQWLDIDEPTEVFVVPYR